MNHDELLQITSQQMDCILCVYFIAGTCDGSYSDTPLLDTKE